MIKTQEILVRNPKSKNTICDLFLYEPENIEEMSLGNLYMVAELSSDEDSLHLVNIISSLIKREYYSSPHRGPIDSLEASLKKANQALHEVASHGNLNWLGNVHFICAAINKEQDLFLTQTGFAEAYLYREGKLINVAKKIAVQEKPHPAKTFQSVISGQIAPSDKLLFGTPSLFGLFSLPDLKRLFELPGPARISGEISRHLKEHKITQPLSGLILEIQEDTNPLVPQKNITEFITPPISLEEIFN